MCFFRYAPNERHGVGARYARDILLLGDPKRYEVCAPVREDEVENLRPAMQDLHDTLMDFRRRYGAGRAIAAP